MSSILYAVLGCNIFWLNMNSSSSFLVYRRQSVNDTLQLVPRKISIFNICVEFHVTNLYFYLLLWTCLYVRCVPILLPFPVPQLRWRSNMCSRRPLRRTRACWPSGDSHEMRRKALRTRQNTQCVHDAPLLGIFCPQETCVSPCMPCFAEGDAHRTSASARDVKMIELTFQLIMSVLSLTHSFCVCLSLGRANVDHPTCSCGVCPSVIAQTAVSEDDLCRTFT